MINEIKRIMKNAKKLQEMYLEEAFKSEDLEKRNFFLGWAHFYQGMAVASFQILQLMEKDRKNK
jgi:hypothetical protein